VGPEEASRVDSASASGAAAAGTEHVRRHLEAPRHDAGPASQASEYQGGASAIRRRERPECNMVRRLQGSLATGDGVRCYPLTLIDAHSRFLLRCEGVLDPDGREVMRIFDSAFQEFGLPAAIRSDNGPPFASVGAGGLTKLSVWWIRLGIHVERITPGKPQENGRQERFHRTLKAETARPPRADLRCQQRAFDAFRREYNNERPHEALGQKTPSTAFAHSPRRYPRPLMRFDTPPWNRPARIDKQGRMSWASKQVFISTALAHEVVELRYEDDGWDVVFGALSIGVLTEGPDGPKFTASKGRMKDRREVSGMSSD